MTRLENLLLFILDRAQKEGKKDLSKFQLFKISYLLQIYSIKYAGTPFIVNTVFIRENNGPISIEIYNALENLGNQGYVKKQIIDNPKYGHQKHAYSLAKKVSKFDFDKGEEIFLDNFLPELLPLTHDKLKKLAYATEPMQEIQKRERDKKILKGVMLDFSRVSIDPDVVDVYSD